MDGERSARRKWARNAGRWPSWKPVFLLCCLFLSTICRAWEIRTLGGREFLDLAEIAEFYGLGGEKTPGSGEYRGGGRELLARRDSREITINGVSHWLAFPVTLADGRLLISRMDLGKTIEPAFRPGMIADIPPVETVVLDPGHGGRDAGAASVWEKEKNFTLDVARRVRNELRKAGMRVVMTRNNDSFVELEDRAAKASSLKGGIFVSFHFNAADQNSTARGI